MKMVEQLLNSKSEVNIDDKLFLKIVKYCDSLDDIKLIIKKFNVDVNKVGFPIMIFAVGTNDIKTTKKLIELGVDIDKIRMGEYETLLMFALEMGNIDIIKLLVQSGVDIHVKNDKKQNALLYAVYLSAFAIDKDIKLKGKKLQDVVEMLINNNISINDKDKDGNTAMHYACESRNLELVKLLLQHNAVINEKNKFGFTPLMHAVESLFRPVNTQIVNLLINHGADINAQNNDGNTALIIAAGNLDLKTVKLLLKHNADVSIVNKYGDNALTFALKRITSEDLPNKNYTALINLLINTGVEVDEQSKEKIKLIQKINVTEKIFSPITKRTQKQKRMVFLKSS